jgi:glycosyltransferase involved in cell wall biosynthesis
MIYPAPTARSFGLGVPYLVAIHDLQHRLQPEFPEVSAGGVWEARERFFNESIQQATGVLVDSEVGREDVITFYGSLIELDQVHVLPFLPAPYLSRAATDEIDDVRRRHRLPDAYLLFPAQFWPHKNHVRVVHALAELRRRGCEIPVVMTGSATGEIRTQVLADVHREIDAGGITRSVSILGYVDDHTMACLYSGARGVILPTFFGPTNIPVVEAWSLDLPVLTSDIRGIREQCGDAAILVDPRSVASIADGLECLWTDADTRERVVAAGRLRIDAYGQDDFATRLGGILDSAAERIRSG